jgi:hypothetical protein
MRRKKRAKSGGATLVIFAVGLKFFAFFLLKKKRKWCRMGDQEYCGWPNRALKKRERERLVVFLHT